VPVDVVLKGKKGMVIYLTLVRKRWNPIEDKGKKKKQRNPFQSLKHGGTRKKKERSD